MHPCKGGALPTELIARAPVILRKSPDGKATGAERIGNDGKREERSGAQIPGVSPNSVSAMFRTARPASPPPAVVGCVG